MPRVRNQNLDSNNRRHKGIRLHYTQINLESPRVLRYRSRLHQPVGDQKASVQTDEESNIFVIRKGTKQGDPLSSLLFNTVLQNSLKDDIPRWQRKKGMGMYLSDHDFDCLTNLGLADDVLLFATSQEQLQKILCEFKRSTEKVGLRIHPEKTKIHTEICQETINH